jgi:hypothetical protein
LRPAVPEELVIRLTKLSDHEHRFEYSAPGGAGESLTLVTRSFLNHDLVHFAVESEAGLKDSFYGRLARAGGYARLAEATVDDPGEVGLTEMCVAALSTVAKGQGTPEGAVRAATEWMRTMDREPPAWLTDAFAHAVKERFRRLVGEWKATPFGGTMELRFPL